MGKKKKGEDVVESLIGKIVGDADHDRMRLSSFVDQLLEAGHDPLALAEPLAKLFDAMTRQNVSRSALLKTVSKIQSPDEGGSADDEYEEIGQAFVDEKADGSN